MELQSLIQTVRNEALTHDFCDVYKCSAVAAEIISGVYYNKKKQAVRRIILI